MGIVTGYLCMACLCVLLGKAITHKFHLVKIDRFMMKIHRPVCIVLSIICVAHIIFVYPVLKTRHILITITGILLVGVLTMIIVLYHLRKVKKFNLKLHRILAIIMLIFTAGHMIVYFVDYQNYQNRITDIELGDITITDIKDGTYIGEYDAGYIYAKVEVEIEDGQIVNIKLLEHDNERGALAEVIIDKVIEEQQIDVDAVSSATNSSKVIKKAIENALLSQ